MSLSIKDLRDMAEKEDVAAFMKSQEKEPSVLAEKLREHLGSAQPAEDAAAPAAPESDQAPAAEAAVTPGTEPDSET